MGALKVRVGGAWVDVGAGTDEVYIGTDDPIAISPTAELWYDSDAVSSVLLSPTELLYAQFTADVTITATSAASAQNVINPGSVNYDGSPIMLEFFCPSVAPPLVVSAQMVFNLFDVNTDLGFWGQSMNPVANYYRHPTTIKRRLVPTAGAHSYNVRAWVSAGSGTAGAGTGAGGATFMPGYLRATRVH